MYDTLTDWQRELLTKAQEIWDNGEGELKFTVFKRPPEAGRFWKIESNKIRRGKERIS